MRKPTTKQYLAAALIVISLGIGFGAGYQYKTNEVKNAIKEAFSGAQTDTDSTDAAKTTKGDGKQGFKSKYYKIGDEITFSSVKMKVNSVRSTHTLSAQYSSPWVASSGTKFIVVDHSATNITDSPYSFDEFILFDKDNKQYNASSEAIGKVDNYMTSRELAPGVPETGVSVFIVPESTKEFQFGGRNAKTDILELVKFSVE